VVATVTPRASSSGREQSLLVIRQASYFFAPLRARMSAQKIGYVTNDLIGSMCYTRMQGCHAQFSQTVGHGAREVAGGRQ